MRASFLVVAALVLCALGCGPCRLTQTQGGSNSRLISPMVISSGTHYEYLTDYLPEWDYADSISSSELEISPITKSWEQFKVVTPEGVQLSTLQVWRDGESVSVVVLVGHNDPANWVYTDKNLVGEFTIRASAPVAEIVVMWQNQPLPQNRVVKLSNERYRVSIPRESRSMDRSWIRVYMASDSARFNDLLIPLEKGEILVDTDDLKRQDRQSQVLYSLMVDRFENADESNDAPLNDPEVRFEVDYQGGDIKGITQKIRDGFFSDLGVNTIWISPITQNPRDAWGLQEEPFTRFSGYHGYWPIYMKQVDDRFGRSEDLHEMLDVAHANDMNVILDYVANHLHINSPVLKQNPDWTTPLVLPDGRENIALWDEQRLTTWFDKHIPSLDLEREQVREPMTDSALYWVAEYDFDGFRHDACKHIPLEFWRTLTKKMRQRYPEKDLWQIGETYGSHELVGSYLKSGMIDAQFDFGLYHTALDVIVSGGDMRRITHAVDQAIDAYGAHHTMGNITGNHDKPRFVSLAGGDLKPNEDHKAAGWARKVGVGDPVGYDKLGLMNALIMTVPGVPCIYQGDEFGEPGGNDPDNRRMMRFDGYSDPEERLLAKVKQLTQLRGENMPLLYGDMSTLVSTNDVWLFVRVYMGSYVIVALNNSGSEQKITTHLPAGLNLNQKLNANFGENFSILPDGTLSMELSPYGFEVLTKTN